MISRPFSRTVLILYVSIGQGHRRAAFALRSALARIAPECRVVAIDIFLIYPSGLVSLLLGLYHAMVKLAPGCWNYLYDNPRVKERCSGTLEFLYRRGAPALASLFQQFSPAAVVCTQTIPCALSAHARRLTGSDYPRLVAVPTDYLVHRYWTFPEVDLYLAPAAFSRRTLIERGVPPRRISVSGIPVDPDFSRPCPRSLLWSKYGLSPDTPRVLVMGGGGGRRMIDLVRSLDRLAEPFQIMALAGRDLKLHQSLQNMRSRLRHPLRAFAYLESVDELMEMADVIVTKPGGLTTSEALIKRVPMILFDPLPGQEVLNSRLLEERGAALRPDDGRSAARLVSLLLNGSPEKKRLRQAAGRLRRPRAALLAARRILELIDDQILPVQTSAGD